MSVTFLVYWDTSSTCTFEISKNVCYILVYNTCTFEISTSNWHVCKVIVKRRISINHKLM